MKDDRFLWSRFMIVFTVSQTDTGTEKKISNDSSPWEKRRNLFINISHIFFCVCLWGNMRIFCCCPNLFSSI